MDYREYSKLSRATLGKAKADLVLKNANIVDVFTGEVVHSSVAVKDGVILGVSSRYRGKTEIDLDGAYLAPGLIDAHLHLESTMVSPAELIAAAAAHGTTTFIVDPHEAANVAGADGIDYILDQTAKSQANVYVMMPSCVPATHLDDNGCLFSVVDMYPYAKNERVLGLGEVMDAQSVISADPSMLSKLALFEGRTIDGTVFDTTKRKDGEPLTLRANQVIPGWTEALTRMPVGSVWEVAIPQDKAYGSRQEGSIKPLSALIFKIELLGIGQ